MFDCTEELSKEQLKRIKNLIYTDNFRIINNIIHACDLNQDEDKIIKNIKDYVWKFLSGYSSREFANKVDYFIRFIEDYSSIRKPEFISPSSDGQTRRLKDDYLVICNGHHIYNDFRYLKGSNARGLYLQESYLGSDHRIYLSKKSMKSKSLPVSDEIEIEVEYNSLLAESVFNFFSQPVASYYLIKTNSSPYTSIFTPNFLKENQELIHLEDLVSEEFKGNLDTHTNRLNIIISSLTKRYKDKMSDFDFQKMINRVQLQFCIQSFMKLLIGPMDDNFGNTAIVLTHNGSSIPNVDISPAYDLDLSFNVADEMARNKRMHQIKDFNGNPSTISSLINEFKDIPGFKGFLDNFVSKLVSVNVSKTILDDVFERTNLSFFKERENSYMYFLNNRFLEVLNTYRDTYLTEVTNEVKLGR